MTRSVKPAVVRFYIDADVLGLVKAIVPLRSDITYPGDLGGTFKRRRRPPCPITSTATPDTVWIPETARQGWLIITRDNRIQEHRAEVEAVRASGARMVAFAGKEAGDTWHQLEVLMSQWRSIERLLDEPGPFIYSATRSKLRLNDLNY